MRRPELRIFLGEGRQGLQQPRAGWPIVCPKRQPRLAVFQGRRKLTVDIGVIEELFPCKGWRSRKYPRDKSAADFRVGCAGSKRRPCPSNQKNRRRAEERAAPPPWF